MTSQEYMADSHNNHHTYYMQFANEMRSACQAFCSSNGYTASYLREKLAADVHLNNLKPGWLRAMDGWVSHYCSTIAAINHKLNGTRTYCLADGPCILKAYMRDMLEKETAETAQKENPK
jgi:hypothetical protein